MVISVRLNPQAQKELDDLVRRGNFKDRSEAIRAALDLLHESFDSEDQEEVMIRLRKSDLDRLRRAKVLR